MKLYWHPFSIMPWRVRIALHEKGIVYESIQVDVYGSRHRTPDFLKMNPFGQIPVLEDVEGRHEIAAHLDIIEARLAGQDWLVGDYSLADVCYAPLVIVLARVGLEHEVAARRGVANWVAQLSKRPAIVETLMRSSEE